MVVARLLDALAEHSEGLRRTPLQQAARINYTIFQRYLEYLRDRGLVEPVPTAPDRWALTPRGREAHAFLRVGFERFFRPGDPGAPQRPARAGTAK